MPPDRDTSLPRFVIEVVDVNGAWAGVEQVKEETTEEEKNCRDPSIVGI
jgi:hypothetical protein